MDDLIENFQQQVDKFIKIGDSIILNTTKKDCINKYASISLGGTPSRKHDEYWNGNIRWINSGAITGSPAILKETEFITELGVKNSATKHANFGDTVLSIIEPSQSKVSLILDDNIYFNQSVICISAKTKTNIGLIYFSTRKLIDEIKGYATGAAQQSLNKDMINNSEIYIPNDENINKLNMICHYILKLEKKIRILKEIKSRLLEKYF